MNKITIAKLNALIERYNEEGAMTVRRCYYVLLSKGLIKETNSAYGTLSKLLVKARVEGDLPWRVIIDNSRNIIRRPTYSSFEESFEETEEYFKLNSMEQQDNYIEVWVEKDTASAGISTITYPLDIPLVVARGFSSATYVKNAVDRFMKIEKPIHIIYISDFDPEGNYFPELFKTQLKERFNFAAEITITKLSLTKQDIEENNLVWIPIKWKSKKSEEKQMQKAYFREYIEANGMRKVELDAMAGNILSEKLQVALRELIDFNIVQKNEELSKECFEQWKKENLKEVKE